MRTEILNFFAKYIEKELGIIYSEDNFFQLQNRLEEIAKLKGVSSIEDLFIQAQKEISGAFKQLLLDTATNNETSFFRDNKVYRAIENIIVPEFYDKLRGQSFQIWSAASSTGQEGISLAILMTEWAAKNKKPLSFQIIGSDISERVLEKARSGVYSQLEIQRGMPSPLLIKYFMREKDDFWRTSPDILKNIDYRKQNLKLPYPYRNKFHLVLCRNVLIYQSLDSKIEILQRIAETLVPGGYFILGSGENLYGLSKDFDQTHCDGAVIFKKKSAIDVAG